MTIGDDISEWAKSRALWQQTILQTLAQGLPITEDKLAAAIDSLLDPPDTSEPTKPLNLALASADDVTVTLAALRGCKGVNALSDDQELDLTTAGLTVVYGDNGSGKSGYARLIKEAVGARHPAQILPDVFEDHPDEPSAVIHYAADDDPREHKTPGPADPLVRQMHFYDEHCGDAYLARKSVITYRPSALVLLDGLIDVCDRLRNALADQLRDNNLRTLNLNLPTGTEAAQFAASLTADTTEAAIESATRLEPQATQKRANAISEVARLEASNASSERNRLAGLAHSAAALSSLLADAAAELGDEALERAGAELRGASELREVAVVAATADFNDELPGVGGATWRALWEAARAYSTTDAYHGEQFPVTHDSARCPLCQQELDTDARSRLDRFDQHMRDTTERDAAAAEHIVYVHRQRLRALPVGVGAEATDLGILHAAAPELAAQVQASLESAGTARNAVVNWLESAGDRPAAVMVSSEISDLDALAAAMANDAAAVDVERFRASLEHAQSQARDFDARIRLFESRAALQDEVARLKERRMLQAAQSQVVTTAITAKSTQLTKQYAGEVIKDSFVRETERLRLRRVTIRDLGGNKGQLEQQPGLLGAKASGVQAAQVLSEGEQTAMGLAGFFTEAAFDTTRSALILDDPVTSLDHVRRKYVAARLAELAKDRQVIVFTHDVTFAGELQKQAANCDVTVTPRSIERKGEVPGFVRDALPWKAKDFGARLTQIEQELARLTKERADYGQDDWDKAVGSWAGDLSELWESCVNTEILHEVFDRGTAEVRVMKFRILAAVTHEDDTDFQTGYGACSTWARRHNKAQETNYVPPEPDEMKAEVERIRVWQKRVKKYR
jgi:energy-coupling factor transporter ATP-binding protein EcfA2